jgi:hypothetical protein
VSVTDSPPPFDPPPSYEDAKRSSSQPSFTQQ